MKNPGDRVDRYVVEGLLGRGGMGEVYEAVDERLDRRVALKVLPPDADPVAAQRMLREARAAAAFHHPNAVVVYDVGQVEGSAYIAMELVRGTSLRAYVGDPEVTVARRLRWLVEVARALAAAHAAGLVHRDVKPDNVMIATDGTVKVLDFGIARRRASEVDPSAPTESKGMATLTEAGVVVGTPLYCAPEQLRSEDLDGRVDQFAWGVMGYELLTGRTPWRAADAITLLSQILSADVRPPSELAPEVPAAVDAVVLRSLSKRAADRFATIGEAADALEPLAEAVSASGGRRQSAAEIEASAKTPPSPTLARRVVRRAGRLAIWLLATVGALIVGIIAFGVVAMAVTGKTRFELGNDPVEVDGFGCEPATVTGVMTGVGSPGGGIPIDAARAIGFAACARLGTEIGTEWSVPDSKHRLRTTARIAGGSVEVEVSLGEQRAQGKGPSPLEAVAAATAALSKKVIPRPLTDKEIKAWGARDAASARRIERVWRRLILNLSPSHEAAVKELLENDGDSPWPHLLAAMTELSSDATSASVKRATELVDRLPPARAQAMGGVLLVLESQAQRGEAMKRLRQAYAEAPDDPDVAALYAAVAIGVGATDEGFSVVDRVSSRHPTRSALAINNALLNATQRDLARDRRLLDRLWTALPESIAWSASVQHLIAAGSLDEARAAIAFGKQLGMSSDANHRATLDVAAALLELAASDPAAARERAAPLLADPSPRLALYGAELTIASYYLEGRLADAEAAEVRELERQKSGGSQNAAGKIVLKQLEVARWLRRPPPPADRLEFLEKALLGSKKTGPMTSARVRAELALVRLRADPKANRRGAESLLAEIEAAAEREAGERLFRDMVLLATVPLVRAVRGDAEAARRWRETDRAEFSARRDMAYDAALALEAAGALDEAEKAYLLAEDPLDLDESPLERVAAAIRLARMYRAAGRADEAAQREALVARVWARADRGLAEAIAGADSSPTSPPAKVH